MSRNRQAQAQNQPVNIEKPVADISAFIAEQKAFFGLSDMFKSMLLEQAQVEAQAVNQAIKQQAFIAEQRRGFDNLTATQKQIIINACHELALKPVTPVKTLKATISISPATNSGKLLAAIQAQPQTAQDLLAMVQDRNNASLENRLSALHKRIMEFRKHHGIAVVYDSATQTYSIKNA